MIEQAPRRAHRDEVLDKYIQAIGGAQRVAALTQLRRPKAPAPATDRRASRGRSRSIRAPNQRTTIIHTAGGDSTTTYDGTCRLDCRAVPAGRRARAQRAGARRPEARRRAGVSRPVSRQALTKWRVGLADGHRRPRSASGPGDHGARRRRRRSTSMPRPGCSCARFATPTRRSGGSRGRSTTRTIATWPA